MATPAPGIQADDPNVLFLTVRSSAWKHLARTVDPRREELVFVWGVVGSHKGSGWTIAALPRKTANHAHERFFRARLGDYTIVVPQNNCVHKLNGRTLHCEHGDLCVA